jgi:hypothetical protein
MNRIPNTSHITTLDVLIELQSGLADNVGMLAEPSRALYRRSPDKQLSAHSRKDNHHSITQLLIPYKKLWANCAIA